LSNLERNLRKWQDLTFKRGLIMELERVAQCVGLIVRNQVRFRGSDLQLLGTQTGEEIAAGIRGYQKWVLTPKPDTRDVLISRLAEVLIHVAKGEFDSLERLTRDRVSSRERLRSVGTSAMRTVFICVLPAFVFWTVQRIPSLALGEPIAQYVKLGVGLWAALTLLSSLDPVYAAKMGSIKEITSIISPFSKGKDKD
ncbi:MAG TPA: hypothetical protein VJX67_10805, partial [Blastocatellia bacterium]|nr:hypothetical protein [Blastocatellia bacterium]